MKNYSKVLAELWSEDGTGHKFIIWLIEHGLTVEEANLAVHLLKKAD